MEVSNGAQVIPSVLQQSSAGFQPQPGNYFMPLETLELHYFAQDWMPNKRLSVMKAFLIF